MYNKMILLYFLAYKIHISDDTYSELAITGGFQVEERGVISVKVIFFSIFLLLILQKGKKKK